MQKNRLKEKLQNGETALGSWMAELRSTAVPALFAQAGLDFAIVDMEHGPYSIETMAEIVRSARHLEITPLVRVPELNWGHIGRTLDAGAQGLMLPRVRSADEIRDFISYIRYPPTGVRGMYAGIGNTDFKWVSTKEYIEFIEDQILVIIQIETVEAVHRADEFFEMDGVDVFFIGPEDLSIALGHPGEQDHPEVLEAVAQLTEKAKAHRRVTGIHAGDSDGLQSARRRGVQLITYRSDIEFVFAGAAAAVQTLQKTAP